MAENYGPFFRRPRTTKEVGDRGITVQVSRAVKDGKLIKSGGVYYYRPGWFENLGDKWETKDLYLYSLLRFSREFDIVRGAPNLENSPVPLRKVAHSLRKLADSLHTYADEIDRRADLLALEEESTSEATD
jgi:hypothetical protein